MTLLTFEEILKEIEEEGFWELQANCIRGEEYEEWLRKDKSEEEQSK